MPSRIAKTARVDPRAELDDETEIGPHCVIGPGVRIGRGTRLSGHVCLTGIVEIGAFNTIRPFVAIGGTPQDISYRGSATRVEIGDHNIIAERVTIHRASEKDDGVTRIGDRNHLQPAVHIAHDCRLGDRISIGVGTMLGGHVHVASDVTIGARVGVHQFVTIGEVSSVGGDSKVTQDVPCYMRAAGNPLVIRSINGRMMKERGYSSESLASLHEAHRLLYRVKMRLEQAAARLDELDLLTDEVVALLKFLERQHDGKVGRARPTRDGRRP